MKKQIKFYKYQGAGNDFIMIDNRKKSFDTTDLTLIQRMCDRRLGIGADGLILLQNHDRFDFEMLYFNADGREGSLCGNGGRCIVVFAQFLGIIGEDTHFFAVDGVHEASIKGDWVQLKMGEVATVEVGSDFYFLDTGSPHYVQFVEDVEKVDVFIEGQKIRYSERFEKIGTNVNFVEIKENGLRVATYERGVENETLSCGTGVTAAVIAYFLASKLEKKIVLPIFTKGGELMVKLESDNNVFSEIWLCGKGELVFEGVY